MTINKSRRYLKENDMIVWSGRGFLSVLVLVASFILFASVLPKAQADFGFIISFFVAAAFSWFMGKNGMKKKEK